VLKVLTVNINGKTAKEPNTQGGIPTGYNSFCKYCNCRQESEEYVNSWEYRRTQMGSYYDDDRC
jgi:hypothetical protein